MAGARQPFADRNITALIQRKAGLRQPGRGRASGGQNGQCTRPFASIAEPETIGLNLRKCLTGHYLDPFGLHHLPHLCAGGGSVAHQDFGLVSGEGDPGPLGPQPVRQSQRQFHPAGAAAHHGYGRAFRQGCLLRFKPFQEPVQRLHRQAIRRRARDVRHCG